MQKILLQLPEIKLAGITCRTNNALEINPHTASIAPIVQRYFFEKLSEQINNITKPGTTYSAYTEYESDHTGNYTYFIGTKVDNFDNIASNFKTLVIPSQFYTKFTTDPGKMPDVCINAWHKIWTMNSADLGGKRRYLADFEIYDERSNDHQNTILDIYIGIQKIVNQ